MTIWEIDAEIKRLTELKEREERALALESSGYAGKLYRLDNDSIGKIVEVWEKDGKLRFRGKSLWFDEEDYNVELVKDDSFDIDDMEIIDEETFCSIAQGWVRKIISVSFGIDLPEKEEEEEMQGR